MSRMRNEGQVNRFAAIIHGIPMYGFWVLVIVFFVVTFRGGTWLGKLMQPMAVIHKPAHILEPNSPGYTSITVTMCPRTSADFPSSKVICKLDDSDSSLLYVGFGPYEPNNFDSSAAWPSGNQTLRFARESQTKETSWFPWPNVQGRLLPELLQQKLPIREQAELYILLDGATYDPRQARNTLTFRRHKANDPNDRSLVCTVAWFEMALLEKLIIGAFLSILAGGACYLSYKMGQAKICRDFGLK